MLEHSVIVKVHHMMFTLSTNPVRMFLACDHVFKLHRTINLQKQDFSLFSYCIIDVIFCMLYPLLNENLKGFLPNSGGFSKQLNYKKLPIFSHPWSSLVSFTIS